MGWNWKNSNATAQELMKSSIHCTCILGWEFIFHKSSTIIMTNIQAKANWIWFTFPSFNLRRSAAHPQPSVWLVLKTHSDCNQLHSIHPFPHEKTSSKDWTLKGNNPCRKSIQKGSFSSYKDRPSTPMSQFIRIRQIVDVGLCCCCYGAWPMEESSP